MFLGAFIFLLSFAWMCVHPVGGRRRSESRPRLVPSPSSFLCASALSHSRRAVRIRQLPCIIVPRKSSLPFSVGNSHVGSRTFDPLFRLDDPKLGYTVLDLIFIFGRLAASGPREESSGSICSESVWRQRHGDTGTGKKEKGTRGRGEPPWVRLFERHRVLTPVTFREALQRLPFKWPESARFPAYNLYAYEEKFYNFSSPDPEVRRQVAVELNARAQRQTIGKRAAREVFRAFAGDSATLTKEKFESQLLRWMPSREGELMEDLEGDRDAGELDEEERGEGGEGRRAVGVGTAGEAGEEDAQWGGEETEADDDDGEGDGFLSSSASVVGGMSEEDFEDEDEGGGRWGESGNGRGSGRGMGDPLGSSSSSASPSSSSSSSFIKRRMEEMQKKSLQHMPAQYYLAKNVHRPPFGHASLHPHSHASAYETGIDRRLGFAADHHRRSSKSRRRQGGKRRSQSVRGTERGRQEEEEEGDWGLRSGEGEGETAQRAKRSKSYEVERGKEIRPRPLFLRILLSPFRLVLLPPMLVIRVLVFLGRWSHMGLSWLLGISPEASQESRGSRAASRHGDRKGKGKGKILQFDEEDGEEEQEEGVDWHSFRLHVDNAVMRADRARRAALR